MASVTLVLPLFAGPLPLPSLHSEHLKRAALNTTETSRPVTDEVYHERLSHYQLLKGVSVALVKHIVRNARIIIYGRKIK